MKGEFGSQAEHLVRLSQQAVATINAIGLITGQGTLLFPNRRSRKRPIVGESLSSLLARPRTRSRRSITVPPVCLVVASWGRHGLTC